jgi:hypothetical protein
MRIWLSEKKGKSKLLPAGTPVRHKQKRDVVGIVLGHSFDNGELYFRIDWGGREGFAPYLRVDYVERASPLDVLGAAAED